MNIQLNKDFIPAPISTANNHTKTARSSSNNNKLEVFEEVPLKDKKSSKFFQFPV